MDPTTDASDLTAALRSKRQALGIRLDAPTSSTTEKSPSPSVRPVPSRSGCVRPPMPSWAEVEAQQAERERQERSASCWAAAGVPRRHAEALRSGAVQWDEPALAALEAAGTIVADNGLCVMCGPRGTGKTQIAAELIRAMVWDRGGSAYYGLTVEVFDQIRREERQDSDALWRKIRTASLLVLDELQETRGTDWESWRLTTLLDSRYGALRPTVLLTNLDERGLVEFLPVSIRSRLNDGGGIVSVTGTDRRRA